MKLKWWEIATMVLVVAMLMLIWVVMKSLHWLVRRDRDHAE